MEKLTTRVFMLTETTFSDGTTKTRCEGDISDMEVMLYLNKKAKRDGVKWYPER